MTRPRGIAFGAVAPLLASMVSLCVGSAYAKALFPIAGPAGMTALRNGLSAVLMLALVRPWRQPIGRKEARAAALYGIVLGGMNLSFYAALQRLPLGIAIAIEFIGPLGLAVVSSHRRLDLVWIAFAAVGVAALALPGTGHTAVDPVGVGFALLAALGWASYIVAGRHAGQMLGETRAVALGLCAATLVTAPVGIATAGAVLWTPAVLGTGLLVALLCSAIPYPLEMIGLRRLPRHVFGVVMSLEPAVGALAAWAVLGERLSAGQWLAIGAVVVASCGVTLTGTGVSAPARPQ